jgi:hypothetical protein
MILGSGPTWLRRLTLALVWAGDDDTPDWGAASLRYGYCYAIECAAARRNVVHQQAMLANKRGGCGLCQCEGVHHVAAALDGWQPRLRRRVAYSRQQIGPYGSRQPPATTASEQLNLIVAALVLAGGM